MDLGPIKTPWEARAGIALGWVCGGVLMLTAILWLYRGARPAVVPLITVSIVGAFVTPRLDRRASFKQMAGLRDIDFRVCPRCFYDLRSLGAKGHCPACGEAFDPETLGRKWRGRLEPTGRL